MEFSPEELQRRKQQREELLKRRQTEQAQFKKRLIFAGIALAVAAVVIVAALIVGASAGSRPESTVETSEAPQTIATEPPGDKTVIHFVATGDLNVTDKIVQSGGTELDYTDMLADVMPLLAEADLTTVNFEGNFVGAPYGTDSTSAPSQLLNTLAQAGVDMLQLANSCSINNGITGLSTTLSTVRAAGIEPLGAYATEADFVASGGYTMWKVHGVCVAVVAFTKGMDNLALPAGSERCINLLYEDYSSKYKDVNTEGITDILDRVNKEKPDLTIALLHWGSEYNDTRSTSQDKIRDLLLDNGVDAIVGTHPHYVQPIEYDKSAGTLVAYSLGDFLSDGERMGTEYSIILDIEITKDNITDETSITGYSITPTYSYQDDDGRMRVLRIEPALFAYDSNYLDKVTPEIYADMKNAQERIKARIKPK